MVTFTRNGNPMFKTLLYPKHFSIEYDPNRVVFTEVARPGPQKYSVLVELAGWHGGQ
jgi:hypothetical protein